MTILELDKPVLEARCDEPEGSVIRRVWFMPLALGNLKQFWVKASKYDTLFGEEIRGDFQRFVNMLVNKGPDGLSAKGLFWVIDDFVGVFYLSRLRPMIDADVHYTFFDGRHRGRLELTKAMLKYAFDRYQLRRMNVEIPVYATPHPFKFVKELGFVEEGRRRRAALYGGKWFDCVLFGLLREELSENTVRR